MNPLRRFAPPALAALILASLAVPNARAVTIDMVAVGNAGNGDDTTGYGAVAYDYQIAKNEVTIGQYTAFLNAVAATDTYSLYNTSMATNLNIAGISRSGASGAYTYSVINNGGDSSNRPITFVSWFDSARFANWMANGQPTGAQDGTTTENGAYNLNGATSGNCPAKNVTNPNTGAAPTFYIPTENEWYKAAYYSPVKGGVGSPGYYTYATQSDSAPGNEIGSGSNQANYPVGVAPNGIYSVTQSVYSPSQNYLTDVGAFTNSASYYGTFDQSGSAFEWNDLNDTTSPSRGIRGGSWSTYADVVSSSYRAVLTDGVQPGPPGPNYDFPNGGFRLASPVAVPEPSTYGMALAGLACGAFSMWRRRKRT